MIFDDSVFSTEKAIHAYLAKHGDKVIALKRASVKHSDNFAGYESGSVQKAVAIESPPDIIQVKVVINTTNLYDSHGDVHIKGLWGKSYKNPLIKLTQDHRNGFEYVISEDENLNVTILNTTFEALGSKYKGDTQALVFDAKVDIMENSYMHGKYARGRVKQHSVGMWYEEMFTAIDNKDYADQYANYKKYIEFVANANEIKNGYFFAVTKAGVDHGSAVPRGSNHVTPTTSVSAPKEMLLPETSLSNSRKNFILLHSH